VFQTLSHQYRFSLKTLTPLVSLSIFEPVWYWLDSEFHFARNKLRFAIHSLAKRKTPQDALWSWLLARAAAKRLKSGKSLTCYTTRPHSNLRGFPDFFA